MASLRTFPLPYMPFNWVYGSKTQPDSKYGLTWDEYSHIRQTIDTVHATRTGTMADKPFETVKKDSSLPRSLVIYPDKAFVFLRDIRTLEGGAQQKRIKFAWNPYTGEKYVRKHIDSIGGKLIVAFIATACPSAAKKGFAEIAHFDFSGKKGKYLEKLYSGSITDLYLAKKPITVNLNALFNLQRALQTIHQLSIPQPCLENDDGRVVLKGEDKGRVPCFHGDISPNNIVYELSATDKTFITKLRLIDWSSAAKPGEVWSTPGWNSPEVIKFLQTNRTPQEICDFNRKYARKKDAWAFGLLAASLLKHGIYIMPGHSLPLPCFPFISKRLKVNRDSSLNDAKISSLKQEEVDTEIQNELSRLNPSTQKQRTLIAWWTAIGRWLQVDPDKRCDLSECHLIKE